MDKVVDKVVETLCHGLSGPVTTYTSSGPTRLPEHLDVLFTSPLKAPARPPPFLLPHRGCWRCQDKARAGGKTSPACLRRPPSHQGYVFERHPLWPGRPCVDIKMFSSTCSRYPTPLSSGRLAQQDRGCSARVAISTLGACGPSLHQLVGLGSTAAGGTLSAIHTKAVIREKEVFPETRHLGCPWIRLRCFQVRCQCRVGRRGLMYEHVLSTQTGFS
jgi:hypothetical protein